MVEGARAAEPARREQPLRVVRELARHPFSHTRLVEREGRRWVWKRVRAPAPLGLALRSLTRALLRHELANGRRLAGVEGVAWRAEPWDRDSLLREWVDGVDLKAHRRAGGRLPDGFFDELRAILARVHARGLAYNDLEKQDNVLVNAEGRPVLIDFQICLRAHAGRSRWLRALSLRAVRELQRQDLRYFCKLKRRFRPDLLTPEEASAAARRRGVARLYHPLWRVLHRLKRLAVPKGSSRLRGLPRRRRAREC